MPTLRHLSRLLVVLVLFAPAWTFLGLPSRAQADEPVAPADPIKDRLEAAKEAYRTKIASLKKDVLDSLDTKIKAARKKKDNKAIVDKLIPRSARPPLIFSEFRSARPGRDG
jgi:hypothetical protein